MKNKDNVNVFDCFKKFIRDSNLKKYTPTILMSDHDSTFMSSKFQEILKDNEVIHQPNILDDHHALGLIDSFTRTLKKTLTRLILQNNSANWIDSIDEIVDNHNDTKNAAINDIRFSEQPNLIKPAFIFSRFSGVLDTIITSTSFFAI